MMDKVLEELLDEVKLRVTLKDEENPILSRSTAIRIATQSGILYRYAQNGAIFEMRWDRSQPVEHVHQNQLNVVICKQIIARVPLLEDQSEVLAPPEPDVEPETVPEAVPVEDEDPAQSEVAAEFGKVIGNKLLEAGFASFSDISATNDEALLAIEGIGPSTLEVIRAVAPGRDGVAEPESPTAETGTDPATEAEEATTEPTGDAWQDKVLADHAAEETTEAEGAEPAAEAEEVDPATEAEETDEQSE